MNRQIHLVSRPSGEPTLKNFKLVETPLPELGSHQVLVRNHYLSLDPYMRGRMEDRKSYAAPQPLNAVMVGGTVGEVVASTSDEFRPGDKVMAMGGAPLSGSDFGVPPLSSTTRGGCARRRKASQAMPPIETSRNKALNKAARMELLRRP